MHQAEQRSIGTPSHHTCMHACMHTSYDDSKTASGGLSYLRTEMQAPPCVCMCCRPLGDENGSSTWTRVDSECGQQLSTDENTAHALHPIVPCAVVLILCVCVACCRWYSLHDTSPRSRLAQAECITWVSTTHTHTHTAHPSHLMINHRPVLSYKARG